MRQSLKRKARNRRNLSRFKTEVKKLDAAIGRKDAAQAQNLLNATLATIDRAAKQGVIHDNAAARQKSRLSRKLGALRTAGA
jgi:small subunit ribosomal protein S20